MNDRSSDDRDTRLENVDPDELQRIISRLREVRRRHLGAASGEHFIALQERLEGVVMTLEGWVKAGEGAIDPLDVVARLNLAARQCEEAGLANVGRVLDNVGDALMSLWQSKPEDEKPSVPRRFEPPAATSAGHDPPLRRRRPRPVRTRHVDTVSVETGARFPMLPLYWACGGCTAWVGCRRVLELTEVPSAVLALVLGLLTGAVVARFHRLALPGRGATRQRQAIAVLAFVVVVIPWCVAGAVSLYTMTMPESRPVPPAGRIAETRPAAMPMPRTTAAPVTVPTTRVPVPDNELVGVAHVLAETAFQVERADEAVQNGDLQSAMQHLQAAAALDRSDRLVREMAATVVGALVSDGDDAAQGGDWDRAALRLDEARGLAARFYLDETPIDEAARRHEAIPRYRQVALTDEEAIRTLVTDGRLAILVLANGDEITGSIVAYDGRAFAMEVHSGVTGGEVRFSRSVPRRSVVSLRVAVEPGPDAL